MRSKLIAVVLAMVGLVAGAVAQPQSGSLEPFDPIEPPLPIIYPPGLYLATSNLSPGAVLYASAKGERVVYKRPGGPLTSFTIMSSPPHENLRDLLFANGLKGNWVLGAEPENTERTVWQCPGCVREVVYDPGHSGYGALVSHAFGDARDGEIRFPTNTLPTVYTVRLATIGGTWGGNFALEGRQRLFIATSGAEGGKIWECHDYPLSGETGAPTVYYSTSGPILGFFFTDESTFYYTDGTSTVRKVSTVKRVVPALGDLGASLGAKPKSTVKTEVAFVSPNGYKYTDVFVVK